MLEPNKNQLEPFITIDECIEFIYTLFEADDVIDPDKFSVLLSLMMNRKLNDDDISSAVDKFYQKYVENEG